MTTIILAEVTAHDPATATDRVERVGSVAYNHPTAPGHYWDAFAAGAVPSFIRREIFKDGATFGAGTNDFGELRLNNLDGRYDWLADAWTDGRPVRVLIGDDADAYDTFAEVFVGVVAAVEVDIAEVVIRIHDTFSEALDQPLSDDVFAGTGGVEGADTLKDQAVAVLAGRAFNVPLDLTDAALGVCVVCDTGPVVFEQVRVRGDDITPGVAQASLAALLSTAPASGVYDWYPGSASERAAVRFGSALDGQVTADVMTGATAADRTAAQVAALLGARAGIVFNADDLAALDVANSAEVGGWWRGTDRIRQALDAVAATVGAGYWQDRTGEWRIQRIEAPGTPVAVFASLSLDRPGALNEGDIRTIKPLFTGRAEGGLQPWEVTLRFARNYSVQGKDSLADSAGTAEEKDRYATEWLEASTGEDAAVRAAHPLSVPMQADTLFAHRADAEAETHRRQDLYADRRRFLAGVTMTPVLTNLVDLGVTVTVEHPRLGLSAGRNVRVPGMYLNLLALTADLTVWG